jgi:hypothetical protein
VFERKRERRGNRGLSLDASPANSLVARDKLLRSLASVSNAFNRQREAAFPLSSIPSRRLSLALQLLYARWASLAALELVQALSITDFLWLDLGWVRDCAPFLAKGFVSPSLTTLNHSPVATCLPKIYSTCLELSVRAAATNHAEFSVN